MNKVTFNICAMLVLTSVCSINASDIKTDRLRGYPAANPSPSKVPMVRFYSTSPILRPDSLKIETVYSEAETARTGSPTVSDCGADSTSHFSHSSPSARSPLSIVESPYEDGLNLHRVSEEKSIEFQENLENFLKDWKESWEIADGDARQEGLKREYGKICNAFIATNDFYLISYFISHSPKILLKTLSREQVETFKIKAQNVINMISENIDRAALENAHRFKRVFELQELLKNRPSYAGIDIFTTTNERVIRARKALSEHYRMALERAEGTPIDTVNYWKEPTTPEELLVYFQVLQVGLNALVKV